MDESTLRVLRTVNELQFVGRIDPRKQEIGIDPTDYFDPVPLVAIVAELWGTEPRIDIKRELRLLVTKGDIDRVMYRGMQAREYLRGDGKRVCVDSDMDVDNEMYLASVDGQCVRSVAAHPFEHIAKDGSTEVNRSITRIESYTMTKPGLDLLGELAGET